MNIVYGARSLWRWIALQLGKIDALKWLVLHSSGCLLCVFSLVFIFSGSLTHLSTDAIRHGAVRQNYACIMIDAIAQCVIITWNMAFVDYFDSRNWSLSTQSPSYDSHLISINFIQMYSNCDQIHTSMKNYKRRILHTSM